MDLVQIIRTNKLFYLQEEKLCAELANLTNISLNQIESDVRSLILSGDLFVDEKDRISISADHGYYKAKLSINKKGYGFASVEGQVDFFIPAFALNGAFDGDDCLVEITDRKNDEDIEGKVVKVLKRNTTHIVGTYIEGKSKNVVFPDDVRLPQVRIFKQDALNAKNNDKVWVELFVETLGEESVRGKIIEVLGQANSPKAEQMSIIRAHNLFETFDLDVLNCAKKISQEVDLKNFKNRKDFTNLRVITIDGEDARDFDDAISVEVTNDGYNLYVHIADVANYVVENSPLDKCAYKRGTSVYFPNMVIPMLPKELSNGVCSLQEGENRLTLSVLMRLNKDCEVLSSEIKESVIKSCHRMTYTEIQKILQGNKLLIEKYQDVYDDILVYQNIAKKLEQQREKRGEIRFNLPEPFILENKSGEIVSIENRVQDEAHCIIESLMILTNEVVAKTFYNLKLPFVYRVHEKPDEEKVNALAQLLKIMKIPNELAVLGDNPATFQKITKKIEGSPNEKIISKLILRTMMKARYAPNCLGHFGLASEYYCHFTSPIRRYPDLLIHRIIKAYLNKMPSSEIQMKFKPIVERASEQSSITEKNADEVEREVDDYKKCVYMSKFLGEKFVGIISGVQQFGIFVELDNGIEGMIKLDYLPADEYVYDEASLSLNGEFNHFKIGDTVSVIVANTNTQLRQIDFELENVGRSINHVMVASQKNKKEKRTNKNKKIVKHKLTRKNLKKSNKKRKRY